jgi:hypothetical protein
LSWLISIRVYLRSSAVRFVSGLPRPFGRKTLADFGSGDAFAGFKRADGEDTWILFRKPDWPDIECLFKFMPTKFDD